MRDEGKEEMTAGEEGFEDEKLARCRTEFRSGGMAAPRVGRKRVELNETAAMGAGAVEYDARGSTVRGTEFPIPSAERKTAFRDILRRCKVKQLNQKFHQLVNPSR